MANNAEKDEETTSIQNSKRDAGLKKKICIFLKDNKKLVVNEAKFRKKSPGELKIVLKIDGKAL